ncbi:hypothetical protein MCOR02_002329 [Pyricularia oryzae]|nr:hypothetical protein MCOR02_002329 [Pyricularia oryzae]
MLRRQPLSRTSSDEKHPPTSDGRGSNDEEESVDTVSPTRKGPDLARLSPPDRTEHLRPPTPTHEDGVHKGWSWRSRRSSVESKYRDNGDTTASAPTKADPNSTKASAVASPPRLAISVAAPLPSGNDHVSALQTAPRRRLLSPGPSLSESEQVRALQTGPRRLSTSAGSPLSESNRPQVQQKGSYEFHKSSDHSSSEGQSTGLGFSRSERPLLRSRTMGSSEGYFGSEERTPTPIPVVVEEEEKEEEGLSDEQNDEPMSEEEDGDHSEDDTSEDEEDSVGYISDYEADDGDTQYSDEGEYEDDEYDPEDIENEGDAFPGITDEENKKRIEDLSRMVAEATEAARWAEFGPDGPFEDTYYPVNMPGHQPGLALMEAQLKAFQPDHLELPLPLMRTPSEQESQPQNSIALCGLSVAAGAVARFVSRGSVQAWRSSLSLGTVANKAFVRLLRKLKKSITLRKRHVSGSSAVGVADEPEVKRRRTSKSESVESAPSKAGQARRPPAEYNSTPPTQDNSIEGERRGLVFDLKLANQQLREQEAREGSTGHTISAEHGGYLALRTRSFAVQVDLETPPLLESHPRRRLTEPLSTSQPKTRTVSARQEQWNRAQHFNLRVPKHAKGSAMCPAKPSPDLVEPDTLAEYGHGSEESRVPSDSQAVNRTIARSEFDPDRA